jgi:cytoskeletal protein CcmA (bactofilin family)
LSSRRPASKVATSVPVPPEEKLENGSNGQRNSVVLGPRDRLVGQLYIEGDLRVSGTVDGALEATGDIEIAGSGKVSGAVTAYNRLVVGSDASLIGGEVRVARLTVEDGATFSGRVSMGRHEAAVPAEPEPAAAEPHAEPVGEQPAAAATTKTPDDFGIPRASVGWSKRRKGR